MKNLRLLRDEEYDGLNTYGRLWIGDRVLQTIERPWIPESPGGKSFESCVPVGTYRLRPHTRGNGDKVVALVNAGHAVYYRKMDRQSDIGRYLVLMHKGNWSHDVVGCIAPGTGRAISDQGPMVTSSKAAMVEIMDYINGDEATLSIEWEGGEPCNE